MIEYLEIGSAPSEEDCVQVGSEDYSTCARMECQRFIALIRECFGVEPEGAKLVVKSHPHDFGTYHEVAVRYDPSSVEGCKYAFAVEANAPAKWNDKTKVDWRAGE